MNRNINTISGIILTKFIKKVRFTIPHMKKSGNADLRSFLKKKKKSTPLDIEEKKFSAAQVKPLGDNWNFKGLRIVQRQYSTHFFHHYTAKFIPQIPQNIIRMFRKEDDIIYDPFMGCGTTLVEAKLLGHKSAGTEINPMGLKIVKAKVTPVDFDKVDEFLFWLSKKRKDQNEKIDDICLFKDSSLWFRKDVRFKIKNVIEHIQDYDEETKNFIEVGLSDHLKGMSNAMMHRTIPTLPKSTNYVDRKHYDRVVNNETRKIDVYSRVYNQVKRMEYALKYLLSKSHGVDAIPISGDSRNLITHLNANGIDQVNIIVTSPPYWNAQNYQGLHSLSIKLFGLKFPKLGEVGRNKKAYMEDMEEVVNQLSQITKGVFAFVIGEDTNEDKYHKQLFDIICSDGFESVKSIRRKLSDQVGFTKSIPHEYIYIFKKT